MKRKIKTVAIIGGGPTGSALGTFLHRDGYRVTIFESGKRPGLLVGESLMPAVIPYLKKLGVEEEVASYSQYKPGATFHLNREEEMTFIFDRVPSTGLPYAYNVPRAEFDATLLNAARREGVQVIDKPARLEVGKERDTVALSEESLEEAKETLGGKQPDLIVDASGRARVLSRLMDVPAKKGDRNDVCLFAHIDRCEIKHEGNIVIDRLRRGWSWRIPLPGRYSIGIVIKPAHLKEHGETSEEQYDSMIKNDPLLSSIAPGAKRVTPVMRYTNYQLIPERLVGKNWVLVGDAAGFVDPIFSTAIYIAFEANDCLLKAIANGSDKAFAHYEEHVLTHLRHWQGIIEHFYSGRLLALLRLGREKMDTPIGKVIDPHMRKHMSRIFTGTGALDLYRRNLYHFMAKYSTKRLDHRRLRIN